MSSIFYRFPHQSSESRLTFDGTHISVFDVKKEVMLQTKMGSGRDFDLSLTDSSSGEVLTDDHHQVPRSTSVIIRRIAPNPKLKNGGTAARYIAGTSANLGGKDDAVDRRVEQSSRAELMNKRGMGSLGRGGTHMSQRFDNKVEDKGATPPPPANEEEARLAAFFNETSNQWEQTHEALSHQTRVHSSYRGSFRPRGGGLGGHAPGGPNSGAPAGMSNSNYHFMMNPDKEPPPGYICFRCGSKGHWIQACPTNENPDFEGKPRFKRTTGIPKSFLKTVEKPADSEGDDLNANGLNGTVMITGDGSFVTVQPDRQMWKRTTKPKALTAGDLLNLTSDTNGGGGVALPSHLTCPNCTRLFHTPCRTPCCKTLFCEDCIHTHLLDNDFVCPNCESKIGSLKQVKQDKLVKAEVEAFINEQVERRKKEMKDADDEAEGSGGEGEKDEKIKTEAGSPLPEVKVEGEAQPVAETEAIKPEAKADPDGATDTATDSAIIAPTNTTNQPNNGNMDPQMMMNMMNMMNMGMMGMNPLMALQAQAAQVMMNLQNHQLPQPMRMQLQMQLNMLQVQMNQVSGMMRMGMGMNNGMGMGGNNNGASVQQQGHYPTVQHSLQDAAKNQGQIIPPAVDLKRKNEEDEGGSTPKQAKQ